MYLLLSYEKLNILEMKILRTIFDLLSFEYKYKLFDGSAKCYPTMIDNVWGWKLCDQGINTRLNISNIG